jgi:hypothetical protein
LIDAGSGNQLVCGSGYDGASPSQPTPLNDCEYIL